VPEDAQTEAPERGAFAANGARKDQTNIVALDAYATVRAPADQRSEQVRRRSFLRSRWDILLVISLGGALGSLARWGVGELVPWKGKEFPWGTFVENVSGGLALGILMVFVLDVWRPSRYARPFLGVGLLAGYTTFSTSMFDARNLFVDDQAVTAAGYLGGSLVAGLLAVVLGTASARLTISLSQRWRRHRRRGGSGLDFPETETPRQPRKRS